MFKKGYRTLWLNAIAAIPAIIDGMAMLVQMAEGHPEIVGLIPDAAMPYYILGVTVMNAILRFKTSTPVGQAEPNPISVREAAEAAISYGARPQAVEKVIQDVVAAEILKRVREGQ